MILKLLDIVLSDEVLDIKPEIEKEISIKIIITVCLMDAIRSDLLEFNFFVAISIIHFT